MPSPRRIAETDADLAEALGVAERTVRRWKRRGCPRRRDGSYDVEFVGAWVASYRARAADRTTGGHPNGRQNGHVSDPLIEARAERMKVRVQLDELELQRLKGQLLPRADVVDELVGRARTLRRGLRGLGRRLCRQLAKLDDRRAIERVIEREHDAILREAYGGD